MPDEDERIGDIAAQLERSEQPDAADQGDGAERTGGASGGSADPTETADSAGADPADAGSDADRQPDRETPPFDFEATEMHGFYVRDETWTELRTTKSAVSAACSTFDVPEFTGREFQDACLRVAADYGEEIAAAILAGRDVDYDDQRLEEIVGMLRDQREK